MNGVMVAAILAALANGGLAVNALGVGEDSARTVVSAVDILADVDRSTRLVDVDMVADAEVGGGCEACIVMDRLR